MTKFADQLYTDLIREHGSMLADTRPPAVSRRQFASRRVLLATGAGGVAVAATAGVLTATAGVHTAGGGTPAYALTTNQDGTVTLAVYQESGIAQANAKLHLLGKRVVVVPVDPLAAAARRTTEAQELDRRDVKPIKRRLHHGERVGHSGRRHPRGRRRGQRA